MSVTRLDTVNVTKPCRACGVDVVTSHNRIPVCAGCRSNGLAGADEVREWQKEAEAARKQIKSKIRKMHTPRLEDGEKVR